MSHYEVILNTLRLASCNIQRDIYVASNPPPPKEFLKYMRCSLILERCNEALYILLQLRFQLLCRGE